MRRLSPTRVMVLLVPLVAVAALWALFRASEGQRIVLRDHVTLAEQALRAERLGAEGERVDRISRAYLLTPQPDVLRELEMARTRFDVLLRDMDEAARGAHEQALLAACLEANVTTRDIARRLQGQRRYGMTYDALEPHITQQLEPARRQLEGRLQALLRHERERLQTLSVQASRALEDSGQAHLLAIPLAAAMLAAQAVFTLRELHRRHLAQAVAERSAAEHAAAEAHYSDIVSIAADAILTLDEAQRITLFNTGAEAIFGYRAREVLGRRADLLVPGRIRAAHRQFLQHFTELPLPQHNTGEHQRLIALRKGGEEFPVEVAVSAHERSGRRTLTLILRDVSEQKRLEDEQSFLVSAGEFLSSTALDSALTLTAIAQLAVEWLADWCLVYQWNGGQVLLSEVIQRNPERWELAARLRQLPFDPERPFLGYEVLQERQSVLRAPLSSEQLAAMSQDEAHLRLLRELHPRSFMAVPLLANGRLLGALVFLSAESGRLYTPRDLEFAEQLGRYSSLALENARLYQSARDATLARDKVLGVVAHDLRSPLQSILLTLKLLRRQGPEPGRADPVRHTAFLDTLFSASHRMSRLIEDLLDVARMEAGQLSLRVSPQPPEPLLREAVETARLQAPQLLLRLEPSGALPAVLVDQDRILQVFSNLLGNALKFTPPGGEVRVGAWVEGSWVVFFVADTGPGIPPEARDHIFERFWQARQGDRRGAGLGLSIAWGIIEAHGGRLRVESEPGRGSTFFFSVPIAPGAFVPSPEPMATV